MKVIFVDEFSGKKNKKLYGLSLIVIDNIHYRGICEKFAQALLDIKWPKTEEFKGRYLFSGYQKGGIAVEETIDFVKNAIDFLSGQQNNKCEIVSVYNEKGSNIENYCDLLKFGISKIKKLQRKKKQPISSGKQNACLFYDGFSGGWNKKGINRISDLSYSELIKRNYFLYEGSVTPVDSHNQCVGVCYADILSYLICWKIETPNFDKGLEGQQSLFDFGSTNSIQQQKADKVKEIINQVKQMKIYPLS